MKRKISLMLILSSLLLIAASCGDAPDDKQNTTDDSSFDDTSESTTQSVIEQLPDADFDGYEFTIFGEGMRDYFNIEEQTGDVISDAVYDRNKMVAERYNINFSFDIVNWGSGAKIIEQNVLAEDNTHDLLTNTHLQLGNCVFNSYFRDWNDIPHVDLTKDYYVKDANDTYSIGDKTMLLFGDFMESTYLNCWTFIYNKEYAEQYNITDLYETVDSGKWTIDYLTEIVKDITVGLDGNTVYDENDFYGLVLDRYGAVDSFVRSFGLNGISKDEDNYPKLDFYNEKLSTHTTSFILSTTVTTVYTQNAKHSTVEINSS